MTPKLFREQARAFSLAMGRPPEETRRLVEVWDATYGMPWTETRACLCDVALASLLAVSNATLTTAETLARELGVSSPEQITNEELARSLGENQFLLFIDDDDWLRPDLVEILTQKVGPGSHVIGWAQAVFGGLLRTALEFREVTEICYSNTYAMSPEFLNSDRHRLVGSMMEHYDATETFKSLPHRVYLADYLSVTVRTPASFTYLYQTLKDNLSQSRLRKGLRDYNEKLIELDLEQARVVPWAIGSIGQIQQIFQEVAASERH